MSKLQILVPQYNEDDNKIKPLLDSIAIQQDIDFNDIEVFIGNDGSDTKLSIDFLKTYNFRIQYHYFEHGRLAATRQKLFDLVTAPYVMWCDADDQFISTIALSMIFQLMSTSFDILVDNFIEQQSYEDQIIYIPHQNDSIFVHGKVYRTEFLRENQIHWHPELHEHQDSPFNVVALTCSKNTKTCSIPYYMWCNNKDSISRVNGKYHLPNTWSHMIDSYQALIDDLKDRGYGEHSRYYAKYCLYATYYEMQHEIWKQDDVSDRRLAAYKRLVEFYKANELLIKNYNKKYNEQLIKTTKQNAERKGKLDENAPAFDEWLNSILTIYK